MRYIAAILVCIMVCSSGLYAKAARGSSKSSQIYQLKRKVENADRKMSLTFNKTDIRDIIHFFSTEFGMNIISSTQVKGAVSFNFKDLNIIDAFDSILISQGFDWHLDRNVIYVYLQQPAEVINLNYTMAEDVASPVAQMLTGKGSISVDSFSNSLVVRASRGDMQRVKRIVAELDRKPMQVLAEVAIMDVQGDSTLTFGVGPNITQSSSGSTYQQKGIAAAFTDGSRGLFVNVIDGNFNVLLEALESDQNVDLLATPKILTLNHKKAQIITGQRLGYQTNTASTDGNFVAQGVEFLEVGTSLTFTPHIADNGDITMEIKPEVSEGTVTDGIPNEDTTEAHTTVLVRDGQTVLIGGLIREKTTRTKVGVPILSRIPVLGWLFRKTSNVKVKKETIVLITPRLVTPDNLDDLNAKWSVKKQ